MRDGDDYLMGANSEQYWGQRSEFDVDPSYLSQYVNDTFGSPETSYYEEEPPRHLHSMSSSNLNRLAGPPIPQVRPQSVPPPSSSRDKNNSRPAEGLHSPFSCLSCIRTNGCQPIYLSSST